MSKTGETASRIGRNGRIQLRRPKPTKDEVVVPV
jgi:hypothetical protein